MIGAISGVLSVDPIFPKTQNNVILVLTPAHGGFVCEWWIVDLKKGYFKENMRGGPGQQKGWEPLSHRTLEKKNTQMLLHHVYLISGLSNLIWFSRSKPQSCVGPVNRVSSRLMQGPWCYSSTTTRTRCRFSKNAAATWGESSKTMYLTDWMWTFHKIFTRHQVTKKLWKIDFQLRNIFSAFEIHC